MDEAARRLRDLGLRESDLTKDEMARLRREIGNERRGKATLDGVLSDPSIIFRRFKRR